MPLLRLPLLAALCLVLAGCISRQSSTPIPAAALPQGVRLVRALPEELPGKSSAFPHSQFVLLAGENFAELLNPIPFVADLATDAIHQSRAAKFEAHYRNVHPYLLAQAALAGSPLLGNSEAPFTLRPFVFLQAGSDDHYRLAYVFQVDGPTWHGRYFYHLPTTIAAAEVGAPGAATLAALNRDLTRGAALLRDLMERDARGQLPATGPKATLGSLHLVGHGASGLVSPNLVLARDTQIIEEDDGHLLVRMTGDASSSAVAGGLFFGVHWFTPDQVHTLKRK